MQFGLYVLKFAFFANVNAAALEMTRESLFLKEARIIVLSGLSWIFYLLP